MQKNYGGEEQDEGPIRDDEKPQEPLHPAITRPAKSMQKTAEALDLLGAGQPYMSRNC